MGPKEQGSELKNLQQSNVIPVLCEQTQIGVEFLTVLRTLDWSLQKLGLILESKVVQNLSLEKNVLYKKCSPKLIFLDKNFFEINQLILDIEN